MAATFAWYEYNGASTTETSLGTGGNLTNFKAVDSAGTAAYDTSPITAGQNSFEKYLKGGWAGTFNKVNNLQFWMSTNFSPVTGLAIKWKTNGTTGYIQPVTATSTVGATAMPTADPAAENVYIGGAAAGSLTAAGKSDYIEMQLQTTTAAAAGDTSLAEFTLNFGALIAVMLSETLFKFGEHLNLYLRQSRAKLADLAGRCNDLTERILFQGLRESLLFMVT